MRNAEKVKRPLDTNVRGAERSALLHGLAEEAAFKGNRDVPHNPKDAPAWAAFKRLVAASWPGVREADAERYKGRDEALAAFVAERAGWDEADVLGHLETLREEALGEAAERGPPGVAEPDVFATPPAETEDRRAWFERASRRGAGGGNEPRESGFGPGGEAR
ncbi:MAG TPA: hypothetical protein VM889_06895 [Candidatus Thermoplasmatota archaeon]|nr:hypothetical protein [Candidatus Thermoplasmatota archaeon]